MFKPKMPIFGANYYPEAWERSQIDQDLDLMQEMGLNCVRIGEFAWSTMEKEEGKFDFSIFREVVDKCKARGMSVIMGTPTACPPRWLERKYPDLLLESVTGRVITHGTRRCVCPNSKGFLWHCDRIVEEMAKEFCDDENVIGWQIDNEISPIQTGRGCCCPNCVKGFGDWLKEEFQGDIEKLNRTWGTYIFSQDYRDFTEFERPHPEKWTHPSYNYAWATYQQKTHLDFIKRQYDILKKYVKVPVGHDTMSDFSIDRNRLAKETDVIQFNHYWYDDDFWQTAFWCDMYRPMKDRPFWVTETSPCWNGDMVAWHARPKNFNRINVWLPLVMGAECTNYWLWRSHYGGQELMHGACLSSAGRPMHVAAEIKELSKQFEKAGELLQNTKVDNLEIAVHVSFKAFDMYRFQKLAVGFDYYKSLTEDIYKPLMETGLRPDVVLPHKDLSEYKVLLTPFVLNLDEDEMGKRVLEWTKNGGVWIVGPMTDIRNEWAAKYTKEPTSLLEKAADIKIEYTLPYSQQTAKLSFSDGRTGESKNVLFDALTAGEKAECVATYANGEYLEGKAAITVTPYGKGKIVTLGCLPDGAALAKLVAHFAKERGILPVKATKNVITVNRSGNGERLFCVAEIALKEGKAVCPFEGEDLLSGEKYHSGEEIALGAYDVLLIKKV